MLRIQGGKHGDQLIKIARPKRNYRNSHCNTIPAININETSKQAIKQSVVVHHHLELKEEIEPVSS